MKGWTGQVLRVNLSNNEVTTEKYPKEFALQFVGGRGFAAKILWDEVPKGTNPLSPGNKFIAAVGPLSGLAMPNVGKVVVAAKSPLTGGYGDGNLGSYFGSQLRRSGYDVLVVYCLKSGVDLCTISHWLGHASVDTTNRYAAVDLEMKREALARIQPAADQTEPSAAWRHDATILEWLEAL